MGGGVDDGAADGGDRRGDDAVSDAGARRQSRDGGRGSRLGGARATLESLALFAILVLVAHVAGRANAMTALGAALFFYARLSYAAIYWAGIAWVRTVAWAIASIGLVLILLQLL
jgi:uncharacterized MAPEG superfamily protein